MRNAVPSCGENIQQIEVKLSPGKVNILKKKSNHQDNLEMVKKICSKPGSLSAGRPERVVTTGSETGSILLEGSLRHVVDQGVRVGEIVHGGRLRRHRLPLLTAAART